MPGKAFDPAQVYQYRRGPRPSGRQCMGREGLACSGFVEALEGLQISFRNCLASGSGSDPAVSRKRVCGPVIQLDSCY